MLSVIQERMRLAEVAKVAALEAEKKAAKEAAEKEATKRQADAREGSLDKSKGNASDGPKKTISEGFYIPSSEMIV